MDPTHNQDVIRCDHCEAPVPPKHCDICHIHLCEACVGEHLSDESKEHCIVPYKLKGSMDSLQDVIRCDLCENLMPPKHCDICHIHLCEACVGKHLSDESKEHCIVPYKLKGSMDSLQDVIRCDLCENLMPPKHCDICHIHLCEACVGKHLSDESKEHCIVPYKMKGSMDSLQDVIRCDLCETPAPPKHCDICHIHLCEACVGEHLSDESKEHCIVPYKMKGSIDSLQDVIRCDLCETPMPPKHCDICHIHLCEACVGKHLSDESKEHCIVPYKMKGSMDSLQDVIRCDLCETPAPPKHCDICHIHLCEACVGEHLSDESKEHCIVPYKMKGSIDSLQDVIRCDLCETPMPPKHCDICHIHLCEQCKEKHQLDKSKDHYILPYKMRGFIPECTKHSNFRCKKFCKECDMPICTECEAWGKHFYHKKGDILKFFEDTIDSMQIDLKNLELFIYPKYQNIAKNIPVQRGHVNKHSQKLTRALDKQGEALHKEIDTIIQGMKSEIAEMDAQHIVAIDQQENIINHTVNEIAQVISDLKRLTPTKDVCLVSKYRSRNEEFRSLPTQLEVTSPNFSPREIKREGIYQQIGSLSKLAINYSILRKLEILNEIQTKLSERSTIRLERYPIVCCQNDEEFWVCSQEGKFMRLYNLQGEVIKTFETKSGNAPESIVLTRSGDLVYTDYRDRSINIVSNTKIQPLISLKGWKPKGICSTSSGDLLVIMESDDNKETKVVRYSDSSEKQIIQWNDQGKPLYSSTFPQYAIFGYTQYLIENRNLDICVSDRHGNAVVVVTAAGKFRFRYTGHFSAKKPPIFEPGGITNDSWANILTSDYDSHMIHIIDKDGHFLRFIDNCGLEEPWGLCMNTKYNLCVAELLSGRVMIIQYYK